MSLRLLRAFLGVTFVYAGVQKLADPGYFHNGSPTYIGSQLQSFAHGSPVGPLLSVLAHFPTIVGLMTALAEIAIGAGTLLGIGALWCAFGGFGVNLVLFLSASWHIHPYFIGSDSIYAVAWLALALGMIEIDRRQKKAAMRQKQVGKRPPVQSGLDRREFIRGGALAALTLFTAGIAKAAAGAPSKVAAFGGGIGGGGGVGGKTGGGGSTTATSGSTSGTSSSVQGTEIAKLDSIPVGGAVAFNDQTANVPGALIRLGQDKVVAFSRICTHMGCEVGYDQQQELLVCPCHGAEFDPKKGGAPVPGSPTSVPLQSIKVALDSQTGQIVLPQ